MILPDLAPLPNYSSAVSREGAVADLVFMLSTPPAISGVPSAEKVEFSWQVLELDATFPELLRHDITSCGEDFPSMHALETARALCSDLDLILPKVVSFSDIEAFEGDLLLHWRSDDRGLTLICPAEATRRTKLYRELLDAGQTVKTDIAPDPRASDIAREIQWVWNRA